MTSQDFATLIYGAVSDDLGTYTLKSDETFKAFWYYGRKLKDGDPSTPNPPRDLKKISGVEVIVKSLPDIDVVGFHGGNLFEESHFIYVIPHGDDVSKVQSIVKAVTNATGKPVNTSLIPASEELNIESQYLLTVRT